MHDFIIELRNYVRDKDLPIEVVELVPEVDQTFWVNLIGRGYPTPIREFGGARQDEDTAITRFIEDNADVFGDPPVVHFLLGTRFDESALGGGPWRSTHE